MKRVLLLSQNFPPSTIASVHRCRHLAKYLPTFGWRPTVLAVADRFHKEPPDRQLGMLVPTDIEIVRVPAMPIRPLSYLGVGDLSLRSYAFVRTRLAHLLACATYDAVLITGWPFYHMLMAGHVRRRWKVPLVLDFQDPWVSAEGAMRPIWSKGGLAHRLALALEPRAVRNAAWITSVSDTQNAEMAVRYPWLDAQRMSAIPIGGDPDDFAALRVSPPVNPTIQLNPGNVNLCYVGTFLPRAGPVVRALFAAVQRLRRDAPHLADQLRLVFVGTSNQPAGTVAANTSHLVSPIAAEEGVGDLVQEYPARVPFLEALSLLANAHGLLLLGSDEPHYTASKIYPALMSGRPYLSIFHAGSSSHGILTRAGGGAAFAFTGVERLAALIPAIAEGLARLAEQPASLGRVDPAAYAPYTAHAVAGQFARVFEAASGE